MKNDRLSECGIFIVCFFWVCFVVSKNDGSRADGATTSKAFEVGRCCSDKAGRILLIVENHLRRRFTRLELCADLLELRRLCVEARSKLFNLLLLFLNLPVLFEEFVE